MEIHTSKAVLVSKNSAGRKKFWQILVLVEGGAAFTQTRAWQETAGGELSKVVESVPVRVEPKNVGRANETTPLAQALLEAESKFDKKRDKGYWPFGEPEPVMRPLPMLALRYAERSHDVMFPCVVQPKMDGVRMLFDGKVGWSRDGNDFDPQVLAHLAIDTRGLLLDGELMLPRPVFTFQHTVSAVKTFGPRSPLLQYHVYDIVDPGTPYGERRVLLDGFMQALNEEASRSFVVVPTFEVLDARGVLEKHALFTGQGHEGTMIRNLGARYLIKDKSKDLLKLKDFDDDEFPIVGFTQGRGKDEGTVIFFGRSPKSAGYGLPLPEPFVPSEMTGKELKRLGISRVRPMGQREVRATMFERGADLVGQSLTVQFQEYTDDGLPRFPVGVEVRDYE